MKIKNNKSEKIEFVKNNMIDLIPIAKKINETENNKSEIEKLKEEIDEYIEKNCNNIFSEEQANDIRADFWYQKGLLKAKDDFIKIIDELAKEEKSIWISSEKLKQKISKEIKDEK